MNETKNGPYDFSVLRELRDQAKVSLERLSEETGISVSTLTRLESNQNQPSLQTLAKLAERFGMTPPNLLELATASVIERAEERVDLGSVYRRGIEFPDLSLRYWDAKAGEDAEEPHRHIGQYQVTWVLRGRMVVHMEGQDYELGAHEAIKFDGAFEHHSRFLEDTTFIVALVPKRTR